MRKTLETQHSLAGPAHIPGATKPANEVAYFRPTDPVIGLGPAPEPPAPMPSGGLLDRLRRRDPNANGEAVTAAGLEAWCVAHRGVVQPDERPDWEVVVEELRALITR